MTCDRLMWLRCAITDNSTKLSLHSHYYRKLIKVTFRLCWVSIHGPLKIKSGNETDTAIVKIIRDDGRYSKNFQTDMGKEKFYNANVQKLLKKHNINQHYSTYSTIKSSVVESLKKDIWKQFTHNGNCKWIDLPRV